MRNIDHLIARPLDWHLAAARGNVVTQGHADVCEQIGHNTFRVIGWDPSLCARCGEFVTAPASTPASTATVDNYGTGSYGQAARAAHRLTDAQVDALDGLTGLDPEDAGYAAELAAYRLTVPARTWHSLTRRGYVTDAGITPLGTDALYANI